MKKIFNKPKVICVVGDVNSAKSNLLYHIITELRKGGEFDLWIYGLRNKIKGAKELFSVKELEEIRNSIIILDEVMSLWDLDNRKAKKQIENTLRLINHNNNILVICGLPENLKKFICGKIDQYFFKKCTLDDFIQGSKASRICREYKGIELGSAVLSIGKGQALFFDGSHYTMMQIPYLKGFDSKKNNVKILRRVKKRSKFCAEDVKNNVPEKDKLNQEVKKDESITKFQESSQISNSYQGR